MKTRESNKKGISLIVLVITIIVMIILAGSIIITLGNSGIIGKANEAVDTTNLKQVEQAATLAWADAYAGGARTETELKASVEESLKDIDTSNYTITVTEQGVTVTVAGEVPSEWAENVTAIVDGVPIPKGFVASPYGADETNNIKAENTKNGGLVIYELTDTEITNGATTLPSTETQFESWTTRNQYVWVPVDKENFATQFVRKDFLNETSQVVDDNGSYNALGTSSVCWEVIVDEATNLPLATIEEQSATYMSDATLAEVQAMYASVKEYGGFYIARYEAGIDTQRTSSSTAIVKTLANVHSKMNKIPYTHIMWSTTNTMSRDTGAAVDVARSLYTSDTTDENYTKYGVVSTLTYGVQWDRTLQWWLDTNAVTSVTDSTAYGNYYDHDVASYTELNSGAKYTTSGTTAFADVTETYTKGSDTTDVGHILTTGALKAANVNNIYDMAGNMYEWTMEGYSTGYRVLRGGFYGSNGGNYPVSSRNLYGSPPSGNSSYVFRPSLYIKK